MKRASIRKLTEPRFITVRARDQGDTDYESCRDNWRDPDVGRGALDTPLAVGNNG
jgi:hypothetical protein